tara:strand:+ start:582 stop:1109 length:528 start_codon:yes stop_codon:yes gene_type:complete
MPHIIKLDDFTNGETTENKYGKFEKVYFKKSLKLEDLNKNGFVKIHYDINNNPHLEVSSNNSSRTVVTNTEVETSTVKTQRVIVKGVDIEEQLSKLTMKLEYLEKKIQNIEQVDKVVSYDIDEEPCPDLYLIEFNRPRIGLFGVFTLNDSRKYLYICYQIDNNISYWKLIHKYNN